MSRINVTPDTDYRTVIMVRAAEAQAEIHAMCESARRSLGQLTRKDYLAKRLLPTPTPAPEQRIGLGSWFEPAGTP